MGEIPQKLVDIKKKSELQALADKYGIKYDDTTKKGRLRRLIAVALEKEASNIDETPRTKDQLIADFIRSVSTIEGQIEPYKDQLKDLKKSYKENNWLTAKEQSRALKAFALVKKKEDIDELVKCFHGIKSETGMP